VRDLIRLVEDDGWYLVGQTGSHRQYKHPTKPGRVTIAGNSSVEVPPKTEHAAPGETGGRDTMSAEYAVLIEQGPTSFGAYCPDLPGVVAAGETFDEVVALMREGSRRLSPVSSKMAFPSPAIAGDYRAGRHGGLATTGRSRPGLAAATIRGTPAPTRTARDGARISRVITRRAGGGGL
jgi:predicted RNA binding protein YcfA (HicA-like mRNA interferase family)